MTSYHYSSNKYMVGKSPGQEWVTLRVNNMGEQNITFTVKAFDGVTGLPLPLYLGENKATTDTVTAKGFINLKIHAKQADKKVALELTHDGRGAGISVRQSSSSSGGNEDSIQLNLK
ncbi:hypothetical protein [Alteribacter aurantiacus]|uniref:hypothetical protein n=1 Tax=Alteribacter aurantiacus TaxID=254410 RepID=UPI000400AA07|nr:hypothetical protein [Alteribacter aurantiacus]